ncbi:hypothetical protein WOLCODRAFT_148656 [Wolfiporia cocos MD-104 SS10]|uniref:Uncharacterized protein n=1 Tax=Wolfiporia cocos (strain MD-104) TaxID=742152 RepID=A0A2H3J637_WOLCO|nr:hypothetical protein WOLCODRAFT_148656 [Wolfiporia cocos MD-104 SS10]
MPPQRSKYDYEKEKVPCFCLQEFFNITHCEFDIGMLEHDARYMHDDLHISIGCNIFLETKVELGVGAPIFFIIL